MNNRYKPLLLSGLAIFLSMVSHWRWFTMRTFTNGDTWYMSIESIKYFLSFSENSVWNASFNFGSSVAEIYYFPLYFTRGLFLRFDQAYELGLFFLFQLPIVIFAPIGAYFLLNKLLKDNYDALLGCVIYTFSTYFLTLQNEHLTIGLAYAFAPITFLFTFNLIEEAKRRDVSIKTIILFILAISYQIIIEPRIFFILIPLFLPIICYSRYLYKYIFPILVGVLFFNLYWILPLTNSDSSSIVSLISRPLFGSQFQSILHAFSSMRSSWTGGEPINFTLQPIPVYFWLLPVLAFSGLLFSKVKSTISIKFIWYIYTVSLFGIFLSKQADAPFPGTYQWLYDNVPGFNLYRESSKFYLLIVASYAILIPFSIKTIYLWLKDRRVEYAKKIYVLLYVVVFIIASYNSIPLFSGQFKGLFIGKELNDDYALINREIDSDDDYYRVLSVPTVNRWAMYSYIHPRIGQLEINNIFEHNGFLKNLSIEKEKIVQPFEMNYYDNILDISAVKYVVVPLIDNNNDDNIFLPYGAETELNIQKWYTDAIDNNSYLKKISIGTKDLVVYENKNFKPHIFALNEMNGLESFDYLEDKYNFLTNEIKSEFVFYDLNKSQLSSRKLYIPFESIFSSSIANEKIDSTIVDNNEVSSVYVNTNKKSVVIRYSANKFEVSKELKNNISFNGDLTNLNSAPEIIYSSKAGNTDYYIEIGSRLVNINKGGKELDLGIVTKPFELFALSKNNAIKNASFEAGGWGKDVGDCNAYDSNSILGMEVSNDASEGETSVQLDATSHIACTDQNDILVDGGQDYLFGFDYQSPNAKNAGFYIEFNDMAKTVISERLPVSNVIWNTFQKKIKIPTGATKMNLVIYSYSNDNKTKVTTKYDNFKLFALEKVTTIDPKYKPHFEKISVQAKNEYKIEYSDPNENFNNLIKNPSLEDGLWSEQVGDCNNYDSDGQLSMNQSAEQKTNGNYSLQLGATSHIACTGPGLVSVIENRTYLFSFDYQSPNGKEAGYYLSFNDPENTVISEHLPIKDAGWHNFTKQIKAPIGASAVSLIVYSYAGDGDKEIINRYDNFSFIGLPDLEGRYFFVTEPKEKLNNPASVDFELINPTKKKVHIRGATTPFYLSMSESYHPQWQAQMNNQKIQGFIGKWVPWAKPDRVSDDKHFELDGFLNGWFVKPEVLCANNSACTQNPDGSYDMEMVIEFFPQRWFYLGLLISGTTLVGCIGYLGYDWRKRRRRKKKKVVSLAAYQEREAEL